MRTNGGWGSIRKGEFSFNRYSYAVGFALIRVSFALNGALIQLELLS